MQSENRFFDDLAKLVNGAAGTVAGMSREFETNAREKAKQWIGGMDFVSRDEFDAVKALAAAAREEEELMKARSEEHTSELQSIMRKSYAVLCLTKQKYEERQHID